VFVIDTHIHTCLSPCAELDMHPAALVEAAVQARLDAVAICDHNSAENVGAVERAGRARGLAVIPGMEITSAEEVHVLGLMPDLEASLELQSRIYRALPGKNDEHTFGMQVVANEHAEVMGFNDHLLAGATTLTVEEVVAAIHALDGLAVASHVDREGFGIIGQLGFIPAGLQLDALEVSARTPLPSARAAFAPQGEHSLLCASDAHEPKDIGRAATFALLEQPTLGELRRALAGKDGRAILGGGRLMEDLALHILDIAQNSIEAGATEVSIDLQEDMAGDQLVIEVCDNGRGMDSGTLAKAADPFYTSRNTRKVGMGLSLLEAAARTAGGTFVIDSKPGQGTRVKAIFRRSHIDRSPLGDIETTIMVLVAGHPDLGIRFRHSIQERVFELDSSEFGLAGIDSTSPEGLRRLRELIRQGEAGLLGAGSAPKVH
jgi:anti-sigma regulatory factor (Ser/Thr protein kinase)